MSITTKIILLVVGLVFFMSLIVEDSRNIIAISIISILVLALIIKNILGWIKNPKTIVTGDESVKSQRFLELPKVKNIFSDEKYKESLKSLNEKDNKIMKIYDFIFLFYWIIFGLLSFFTLTPLYGSGQAQNGMQYMLLMFISIPVSVFVLGLLINLLFKKFVKKIETNQIIIIKAIETLFLPIFFIFIGFLIIFLAEGIYSSENFYNIVKGSLIEPVIRALAILFVILFINKNRIKSFLSKKAPTSNQLTLSQ